MNLLLTGDMLNTPIILETAKKMGYQVTCVNTRLELAGLSLPGDFDAAFITHDHGDKALLPKKEEILKIPYVCALCPESQAEGAYNLPIDVNQTMYEYYMYSGQRNIKNLFLCLNSLLGKEVSYEPPTPTPCTAIFDEQGRFYKDLISYEEEHLAEYDCYVGLLTYRSRWQGNDLLTENALIHAFNQAGIGVICGFYGGTDEEEKLTYEQVLKRFFYKNGKPAIYGLINLMFTPSGKSLEGTESLFEQTASIYAKMNIPIFHPMECDKSMGERARHLKEEITPNSVLHYDYSELQGMIEPVLISFLATKRSHEPIEERVQFFVQRVCSWINLKKKQKEEKKAVIVINSSVCSGVESTLGRAVGLNTFDTVHKLLVRLKEEGYQVQNIPENGKELRTLFLKRKAYSDFRWTSTADIIACKGSIYRMKKEEYLSYFQKLPKEIQKEIIDFYGEPLGEAMVYDNTLVITGISFGNVIVCVQPKRGCYGAKCTGEVCKILKDPTCPPTHQYMATYHYFRHIFQTDVLFHVGTHGSLEYTPDSVLGGKGITYPALTLGEVPYFYIFSGDSIPAAMLAKRRSHAVIIDHEINEDSLHTISEQELESVLNGMQAGYIRPGAGYHKGEAGFCSGRNLYGIEENRIPDREAFQRGCEGAKQLLDAYLKEDGHYPEAISLNLSALDIVRTKGEQISMMLALIGARVTYHESGRVAGIQMIPTKSLTHPRIDVCVQVSSLLRDIWPNLLKLCDQAIVMAASMEESEEINYIRKHMKHEDITTTDELYRIYGSCPGTFTSALKLAMKASAWDKKEDLAAYYVNSSSYAYKKGQNISKKTKEYLQTIQHVDASCSMVSSTHSDGIRSSYTARMQGGVNLAAAVICPDKNIRQYVTVSDDQVTTGSLKDYVRKGLHETLLNDSWKERQMKEGYDGAAEIMTRFQNVFEIQCLGHEFSEDDLNQMAASYLLDETTCSQLLTQNPYAVEEMTRRMMELKQRKLWKPDQEITKRLTRVYLSMEGELEDKIMTDGEIQAGEITVVNKENDKELEKSLQSVTNLMNEWHID